MRPARRHRVPHEVDSPVLFDTNKGELVDVRRSWMRRSAGALLILALGVVLGCGGEKKTATTTTSGTDAASYDADVKEFMTLTGSDSVGIQMAGYISASIVGSLRAQRRDATEKQVNAAKAEADSFLAGQVPDLMNRFFELYKKYYTHDEIKELIAFYKTPTGAKFARLTPTIGREGTMIGEEWGRNLGPELGRRVMGRLQAEGLTVR
jgi:uncharacterized protein